MAGCTTIITKQGVMITANAPNISCSDRENVFLVRHNPDRPVWHEFL